MPKLPEPSDVLRETLLWQLPRRVRKHLRWMAQQVYLDSLALASFPELPWNQSLLRAVLLDLSHLERHLRESYMPEDEARGWREERLAEVAEEILPELASLIERLRKALPKKLVRIRPSEIVSRKPKISPPILLSIEGVAALTNIGSSTLRRWRDQGGGPPFRKLGGRYIYDQVEVIAWLETYKVEPKR